MASIVTSKGQVTIPKRIRDHLGIKPGTAVNFELNQAGQVVVSKQVGKRRTATNPFARVRGSATADLSTDEIMALTRSDE